MAGDLALLCLRSLGLEFLHPSGGINDLLGAGEERMAGRADFHVDRFLGGTCFDLVAASA